MARYIDADAFKQKLADKDIFFPALYKNELDEMPTADVVPKSEVAREIFEEIENLSVNTVDDWGNSVQIIGEIDYAELKKKYTDPEQCPDCKHFVGCECFGGVCDQYEEKKE